MNILIIEDDREIAEHLNEALTDLGHQAFTAFNGREGLKLLDKDNPKSINLILVDLMMPVMNGEEFVQALSEREELKTIPVVMMTASQKIPVCPLPLKILRKPFNLDHLVQMIAQTSTL